MVGDQLVGLERIDRRNLVGTAFLGGDGFDSPEIAGVIWGWSRGIVVCASLRGRGALRVSNSIYSFGGGIDSRMQKKFGVDGCIQGFRDQNGKSEFITGVFLTLVLPEEEGMW